MNRFTTLGLLAAILSLQGCLSITHYAQTRPVEVVLQFDYQDGQGREWTMSQDFGFSAAQQLLNAQTCHRLMGSWPCDRSIRALYSAEHGPLDEAGQIKVVLRSAGPIGDHPTTYCIQGQGYTFIPGPWQPGPFQANQVVRIHYKISRNDQACRDGQGVAPAWWPGKDVF